MPAAVNCLMKPSGTRSGASVTSIAPLRGRVSVFRSSAVGARNDAGVVHARLLGRQERPLQVDAKHARIAIDKHRDGRDRSRSFCQAYR